MSVIGSDSRQVITTFSTFPLSTVTTVDIQMSGFSFVGTGIAVGSNHVLTAAHNAYDRRSNTFADSLRTTLSTNEDGLTSRIIGNDNNPPENVTNINFLADYDNTELVIDDIALLSINNAPIAADDVIGLTAFVSPRSARGLTIDTAGYPGDNLSIPNNSGAFGRDLVRSPGAADAPGEIENTIGRRLFYSPDVDTFRGQSGSGVWHTLAGDNLPRVLGVHTQGTGQNSIDSANLGLRNSGVLITTDIYDAIVAQILADSGSADADILPENAIIGTDNDDFIRGTYRRERILGNAGNDQLLGSGADDRLEGGDGLDQALFSDVFTHYNLAITGPNNPAFEFQHISGTQADGTDTTQDIEFGVFEFVDVDNDGVDDDGELFYVPLNVDPTDNTKLKDGPPVTPEAPIINNLGDRIGTLTFETPAWTVDGDIDYTLRLGGPERLIYNLVYTIDVSGSVIGGPLAKEKFEFTDFTDKLQNQGIADNSRFAIIPFANDASLISPLSPEETKTEIGNLVAAGATNYNAALQQASLFLAGLPGAGSPSGGTNIVYFVSDGQPNVGGDFAVAARNLKDAADVRTVGVGPAFDNDNINNLLIIDSDGDVDTQPEFDGLADVLNRSPIDPSIIDRIDVKLDDIVIDTILPSQLVSDTLGLIFQGSISGLDVSRAARNNITFDVVLNNQNTGNIPSTSSLSYAVTTGQEQIIINANGNEIAGLNDAVSFNDLANERTVIFSVNQLDFFGTPADEEIIGNDLDNVIFPGTGNNTVRANGGDDRITLSLSNNTVDGGDGIDTVVFNQTRSEVGDISITGNIIDVGSDTTLLNVEFIEFSDVRVATDTLMVTPILSITEPEITVVEGDANPNQAIFTLNLSSVATEDVVIDVTSQSQTAKLGTDFVEVSGQLIIPAGQTSATVAVEILDDANVEGEENLSLTFSAVSGATFANGAIVQAATVNILDNDSAIGMSVTGDNLTIIEGTADTSSTLTLSVERFGDLKGSDTVEISVISGGSNPAQASDLVNGFSSSSLTFAPGENSKTIDIEIVADDLIETDETFGIQLTSTSGSALVPSEALVFTILDDDSTVSNNPLQLRVEQLVDADGDGVFSASETGSAGGNATFQVAIANVNSVDITLDAIEGSLFDVTGSDLSNLIGTTLNASTSVTGSFQTRLPKLLAETIGTTGDDILTGQENIVVHDITVTASDASGRQAILTTTVDVSVAAKDTIAGQLGNDTIFGGSADDILRGDLNRRDAQVGIGDDDTILGGAGNDRIGGKGGNDKLLGESGDDYIWGDDGDDLLWGGLGNDILMGDDFSGGQGADTFILAIGEGTDTIVDFEVGTDLIGLAGGLTLGALSFETQDQHLLIKTGAETLAILQNVDSGDLASIMFESV